MSFEIDLLTVTEGEFSETLTLNGEEVSGLFDLHSNQTDLSLGVEVNAFNPVLIIARASLSTLPVEGDPVIIRGVSYSVTEVRETEFGTLTIHLQDES